MKLWQEIALLTTFSGMSRLFGEMYVAAIKIPKEDVPYLIQMNYLYFGMIITVIALLVDVLGTWAAIRWREVD